MINDVAAANREVGRDEVVTRFRALADGEVTEKSPGDFVTFADQECERVLAARLREIRAIPVVGEEATAADPTLLDLVASAPAAWIVDPIDGTSNFIAGNDNFVIMVALVEDGAATAAWVWHPASDSMLSAARGNGTSRNETALRAHAAPSRTPRGILKRKYVPEPARTALAEWPSQVGELVAAQGSAGIEYAALIDGEIDFLMYWRTLPWDHAPCALLAAEAGFTVARLDGTRYDPGDGRHGLLAAHSSIWQTIADEINAAIETLD